MPQQWRKLGVTLSDTATTSFIQCASAFDITVQDTARRIREVYLNPSIALVLEISCNTGQCSARSCSTSESINLAGKSFPDFWTCRLDMCLSIGSVIELICPN